MAKDNGLEIDFPDSTLPTKQADSPSAGTNGKPSAPDLTLRFEFSPTIGALIAALAKARKAFAPVIKSSKNPFYKSNYADLAEVLSATTDALSNNGIAVIQPPAFNKEVGIVEIHTFMAHSSGEWVRSILEMPVVKMDPQGVGSAITYGRRYAYSGMVNVGSEADDDGNAASGKGKPEESHEEFDQRTENQRTLSEYQVRAWNAAVDGGKACRTAAQIAAHFKKLGIPAIGDMTRADFNESIKWLLNPDKKDDFTQDLKQSVTAVGKKPDFSKIFALAKQKAIPEDDVRRYCYETFKVKSMTEMVPTQLHETMKWLELLA